MHARTMLLLTKEQALADTKCAPIAWVLTTMDSNVEETLKANFDDAYMLAKEIIVFSEIMLNCQLMEQHKLDLDTGYTCKDIWVVPP